MILAFDDLGYSANTAAVFRPDPFFANVALVADTLRATASRLREDASHTISLLTMALRMNTTALNQADHCIVVRPPAAAGHVLPTVDAPNQVLDAAFCAKRFAAASGLGPFLVDSLAANANELGGTLSQNSFTAAELATLSRQYASKSIAAVNDTQIATTKIYQAEAVRLSAKLGADHPKAVALSVQADAGAQTARLLATQAEVATIVPPTAGATTAAVSVRLVNAKGQGQEGYTVDLLRANGTRVDTLGITDASGFYATVFDKTKIAALAREGNLFLRVTDAAGKEVYRAKDAIMIAPGADISSTLTVPVRVVPKSVAIDGTVIYVNPPSPPPPPPPPPRTSLDKLDIDAATRRRLDAAGIKDVESLLEADPAKLATIVGDRALAAKLIEMSKRLLNAAPAPALAPKSGPPSPKQASRTPLDKLGLDAATRERFEAGGIRDVEGVLEVSATKLAQIVGSRATALKLRDLAARMVGSSTGGSAPPKPATKTGKRAPKKNR